MHHFLSYKINVFVSYFFHRNSPMLGTNLHAPGYHVRIIMQLHHHPTTNNKTRSRPIKTLARKSLQPRPVVSFRGGAFRIRHTDLLRDRSGCITTAVFHTPIASYLIVATWKATSLLNFPRDVGITIIVSCATKTARNITRIAK